MKVTSTRLFWIAGAVIVLSLFASAQQSVLPETTQSEKLQIQALLASSAMGALQDKPSPGCPGGTSCSGKCVDTRDDPNNCGGCGNKCTGETYCDKGSCKKSSCTPPEQTCQCGLSYYCAKTCDLCATK